MQVGRSRGNDGMVRSPTGVPAEGGREIRLVRLAKWGRGVCPGPERF